MNGNIASALPRLETRDDCPPCWERLDRLGWTAGLALESHGARLGIRVNDPALLERLTKILPPGAQLSDAPVVDSLYSLKMAAPSPRRDIRRYHLLYRGIEPLARTHALEEALDMLESDLHAQVALHARGRLFVHAGVAGWGNQAIVIPGRSFTGKTSLIAALVQAGATYYSDEYAVFDAQGRVHPYGKPLSLRGENSAETRRCTAEELGGRSGGPPLPVGMIVVTHYEAESRWRPRRLSPGQALMALLDNTVAARQHPQQALETLSAIVRAPALNGKRGDAGATAAALLRRLALDG